MSLIKILSSFVLMGFIFSLSAEAKRSTITSICSKVIDRTPVFCLDSESALLKSKRIYAWTQFTNNDSSFTVWHIWNNNGKEIFRKKIQSLGNGFRAVTSTNLSGLDGEWQLIVKDESDKILESINFVTADGKNGVRGKILNESVKQAEVIPETHLEKEIPVSTIQPELSVNPVERKGIASGEWSFGIGPSLNVTRLNSTQTSNNSSAVFLSKLNPGAGIELNYKKVSSIDTLSFFLQSNQYQDIQNKNMNLIPGNLWQLDFSHQFRNVFPKVHVSFLAGLKKDFFDKASSSRDLNFSSAYIPRAAGFLAYDLWQKDKHLINISAGVSEYFAVSNSDYTVKAANSWSVQLSENYQMNEEKQSSLQGKIYFEESNQTTSLLKRKNTNLSGSLLYFWRLN